MNDLLSSALNAVGTAGTAIDKITGGRAVRGVLAGKPREAASFVPFSDDMGLTNKADATSGRNLTDAYGVTRKGDNSVSSHAIGFLADNALSPGNWLGAGAAFRAAPTVGKGLAQGAKALSGLDMVDSLGRGVNSLAGRFGKLPVPSAAKYGKGADLADAYANMSKGFPANVASAPYRVPADLAASHLGAAPDPAILGAERRSNDLVSSYLGNERRGIPADYFAHQTTLPGTDGTSPAFSGRFSGAVPAPHVSTSGLPANSEDLQKQLASMGWGPQESKYPKAFNWASLKPKTASEASAPAHQWISPAEGAAELPWQRAVRIGEAAGFPARPLSPLEAMATGKTQRWTPGDMHEIAAWYNTPNKSVALNPYYGAWTSNGKMADTLDFGGPGNLGHFSGSHPDHFIEHELGHAYHAQSVGADRFRYDPELTRGLSSTGPLHKYIAENVSKYGATNPAEAVAEIAAALKGGRQLNPDLAPLFQRWAGPQMYQRLGDSGLLKGLGLSTLGTIGLGTAQNQGT